MLLIRRPRQWLASLLAPRGSLSPGVLTRVLAFGGIGTAVYVAHRAGVDIGIPIGFHEVAGAITALILAFRTNTAYNRFWEGRTLWGQIVNSCRNLDGLVRPVLHEDPARLRDFDTWITVFAHSTRHWLRDERSWPAIERILTPARVVELYACPHPPLEVTRELMYRVAQLEAQQLCTSVAAEQMKFQIVTLINCLGGCERIRRAPTPVGYVILMRRCVALFLMGLPFALVERVGLFAPLVTLLVSYPILMIEALANELDDPFGHELNDLPLTTICNTIETNLLGSNRTDPTDDPQQGGESVRYQD